MNSLSESFLRDHSVRRSQTLPKRANFFLIGAAKAGTTSLARFLETVPDVYLSPIKEPCHFCPDIAAQRAAELKRQQFVDVERYFAEGMPYPVHLAQVTKTEHYAQLFEKAPARAAILGECSTYYLPSRFAAAAIRDYNPRARIMVVTRDPVKRIRSHYEMDWRMGLERRSLAACLQEEIALGDAANFANCRMYLALSDYAGQIERFCQAFPAEQVLVMRFEELIADPTRHLSEVLRFLGLPAQSGQLELPRENASAVLPRFSRLDRLLYSSGLKRAFRRQTYRFLTPVTRQRIKSAYLGNKTAIVSRDQIEWESWDEVLRLVESSRVSKSANA